MCNDALCLLAAGLALLAFSAAEAKMLLFSERLTPTQAVCLRQLFSAGYWKDSPDLQAQMPSIAQAATTRLSDVGKAYIYIFKGRGWCGTAGCPMVIGEMGRDGICRILYDAFGDTTFTVLPRRDNGYRRIYASCEARFDGHQYQQLNGDCPSPKAWR
jgi:hypothetical protein